MILDNRNHSNNNQKQVNVNKDKNTHHEQLFYYLGTVY